MKIFVDLFNALGLQLCMDFLVWFREEYVLWCILNNFFFSFLYFMIAKLAKSHLMTLQMIWLSWLKVLCRLNWTLFARFLLIDWLISELICHTLKLVLSNGFPDQTMCGLGCSWWFLFNHSLVCFCFCFLSNHLHKKPV